jgi:maltose-binding protein MalE
LLGSGRKKGWEDNWETIDLQPIDPDKLVASLDYMAATKTMPPDVISADNDTLGILVQKGLVQELSPYLRDAALPRDPLFQRLQEKHRIDGRDYSVAFHPNVKLMYYNQAMLNKAGHHQPPTTWEELERLARDLHNRASDDPGSWGRVAIQAHEGKAAAVTVFEWVTHERNPDARDPGAREALGLWNLAPYLTPNRQDQIR